MRSDALPARQQLRRKQRGAASHPERWKGLGGEGPALLPVESPASVINRQGGSQEGESVNATAGTLKHMLHINAVTQTLCNQAVVN